MQKHFWIAAFSYRRRGIVFRILALAVFLIAVSSIGRQIFVGMLLQRDVGALAAAHQLSTADYISRDIDEKIRLRMDMLQQWARALPIDKLNQPVDLQNWMAVRLSARSFFSEGLAIYAVDGRSIVGPPGLLTPAESVAATEWFQSAIAQRRPVIGTPTRLDGKSPPVVTVAVPITTREGVVVGVFAGTTALAAPNFLNLLEREKIGETGSVLLIDPRTNMIIASTDPGKVLVAAAVPGVNPLHDRARAGFRGTGETVTADGDHVLSAVTSVPSADWFIVVQQPLAEVYRPVVDVTRAITEFSIGMVIFVFASLLVLLPHLLRPLTDAAEQLHAMAAGERPVEALALRRRDEIGEVVTGFNFLLAKLRATEQVLRDNEARMAHMAHHDALTGLPNRALLEDRLTQMLIHAQRNNRSLALLYLDLDEFKPINDLHGHRTGDEVLKQVASRLTATLRKGDTVARIGGDEFAILLSDIAAPGADPALLADKCRRAIAQPILCDSLTLHVTISIGIAHYPDDGQTIEQLLKIADADMYRAKRASRVDLV